MFNFLRVRKPKPTVLLYIAGTLLLLTAANIWWYKLSTRPEHVFWSTITQSLSTSGVTIDASQSSSASSVHQTMQYSLGGQNLSHSLTTLTQPGTTVISEVIGTPKEDYTRYVDVKTTQKTAEGKPLNLSKILGVWAKNDKPEQFSQAALGTGLPIGGMVVPIGNLTPGQRGRLLTQMRSDNLYDIDYQKVKTLEEHGRTLYEYPVKINAVAYARLMKTFAQNIGLHQLDSLNPQDYKTQKALSLTLTIDVRARHVVRAGLPDSQYKQSYTAYDVPVNPDLPKNPITVAELQKRLAELR